MITIYSKSDYELALMKEVRVRDTEKIVKFTKDSEINVL